MMMHFISVCDVLMMMQDAKGELPPSSILEDVPTIELNANNV